MNFAFEDDLAFQTAEIGMVTDKVIKLIGVMKVRHLIIGNLIGQILRFVNRDIDIRLRMGVTIDKNMPLDRHRAQLPEWAFLLMLAAEHARPRLYDVF